MGQYYVIANLDKRVGYSPRSVGGFVKLMEVGHSHSLAPLFALLGDTWAGDRIALVGDYSEDGDLSPEATEAAGLRPENIYQAVAHNKEFRDAGNDAAGWKPVGWLARKVFEAHGHGAFEEKYWTIRHRDSVEKVKDYRVAEAVPNPDTPERVLVNLDKGETLDPALLGDDPRVGVWSVEGYGGGMVTAAAILFGISSVGGGRGGGDFYGHSERVGSWGGDRIALMSPDEAEGFSDITDEMRALMEEHSEGSYVEVNGSVVGRSTFEDEAEA